MRRDRAARHEQEARERADHHLRQTDERARGWLHDARSEVGDVRRLRGQVSQQLAALQQALARERPAIAAACRASTALFFHRPIRTLPLSSSSPAQLPIQIPPVPLPRLGRPRKP